MSTTLKSLYILWMKLLNIWCKVVQALSLLSSGKEHLMGGSGSGPSAPGCALSPLAQGWGRGQQAGTSRLAHSLFSSLTPTGGQGWKLAPQPGLGGMRSDLQEAALLLAGVLIWCRSSEGEHSEVWLKTGFWFDFVGFCLFLVFFFIICFSPLVPLGQLVSVVIIFGFLSSWFVSSFFGWLDFWSFLPCHSCSKDLLYPHHWPPRPLPRRETKVEGQRSGRGSMMGPHSGLDPASGPPGPPGVCAAASLQVEEEEDEDEEDEEERPGD